MEKALKLKGTEDTPQIVFDSSNQEFTISGRSLPEDPSEFYRPIIAWMQAYTMQPNPNTELNINLDYFNSSSVKQILALFILLEEVIKSGNKAKVVWFYTKGDDLMEIKGQEFKNMLTIPFELTVIV